MFLSVCVIVLLGRRLVSWTIVQLVSWTIVQLVFWTIVQLEVEDRTFEALFNAIKSWKYDCTKVFSDVI